MIDLTAADPSYRYYRAKLRWSTRYAEVVLKVDYPGIRVESYDDQDPIINSLLLRAPRDIPTCGGKLYLGE